MKICIYGTNAYCLPDYARCLADKEKRNPEQLDRCPLSDKPWENDICKPEECNYYSEE